MLRLLLKSELLSLLLVLELLELGLELGSCRRPRRLLPVALLCFFLLFFLPFLFFSLFSFFFFFFLHLFQIREDLILKE